MTDGLAFSSAASKELSSGKPFTWEDLNYVVPVPGGERRLLNNVNGYVKPGTLTALMGVSFVLLASSLF